MTGAAPVLDRPVLRDALSHMRITSPDGIPFEEALAWENDWPLAFADRVADEYCGFLYLAATAGFEVTPSEFVDRAWHLHLAWPHYRDVLCGHILGRPLEHRPGTGEPGEEERYRGQYERTLDLYEEAFGRPPPADIWPWPAAGEPDDEPAPPRSRRIGAVVAVACIAGSLISQAFGFGLLGPCSPSPACSAPFCWSRAAESAEAATAPIAAAGRPEAAARAAAAADAAATDFSLRTKRKHFPISLI